MHSITKYSPEFLFYNNTDEITMENKKKMKDSKKFRNITNNPIPDSAKVLLSTKYIRKGHILSLKFGKTGKRLIPWIIIGQG